MVSYPEAGKQRMVEIAAAQGVRLTTEEVRGLLRQMDEESEFDDIELDAVALAAVAGGGGMSCGGLQQLRASVSAEVQTDNLQLKPHFSGWWTSLLRRASPSQWMR